MCRLQWSQGQAPISNSGPPKGTDIGTVALPAVPNLHKTARSESADLQGVEARNIWPYNTSSVTADPMERTALCSLEQ